MTPFTIYYSNVYQNPQNKFFRNKQRVNNENDLKKIISTYDYTPYEFVNSARGTGKNPLSTEFLLFDFDNDHSENNLDWITAKELQANQLKGIEAYYYTTRSHMRAKNNKSPRPRFRALLPIPRETDMEKIKNYYEKLIPLFPGVDGIASKDLQRLYFGYDQTQIIYSPGISILTLLQQKTDFLKQAAEIDTDDAGIKSGYIEPMETIIPGQRNTELTKFIGHLLGNNPGITIEEIQAECEEHQKKYFAAEYPEKELLDTIKSLYGKEQRKLKKEHGGKKPSYFYKFNDIGDAEYLSVRFQNKFIWCEAMQTWLYYKSGKWQSDDLLRIQEAVKKVTLQRLKEAAFIQKEKTISDPDKFTEIFTKHVNKLMNHNVRARVLKDTRSLLPVTPDMLDSHDYLLNFKNGTLDLSTNNFYEHKAEEFHTKIIDCEYSPKEKPPEKFLSFINQIFMNDKNLINYVQKVFGYALSGSIAQQEFYILHGTGKNGKDQLITIFRGICRDYTHDLSADKLMENKYSSNDTYFAQLRNKRVLFCSESKEYTKLNTELIKRFTGDSELPFTVAQKYEKPISFQLKIKTFLVTNHLPVIGDDGAGVWRRIRPIPFNYTVPDKDRILDYGKKILTEGKPGILNWFLEGWRKYQEEGLEMPDAVRLDYDSYRRESDLAGKFISECCEQGNEYMVSVSDLHRAFVEWSGLTRESIKFFSQKMAKKGFQRERKRDGVYLMGIKLRETEEDEQGADF